MADHQEIRDRAYGFFIQEAPELLQMLEAELLLLRSERTRGRVHNLMRAAHSLKGGAANVGLGGIQTLAHRLEDCFRCFYDESLVLTPDLEYLLLKACDHLRDSLMAAIAPEGIESEKTVAHDLTLGADPLFEQIEAILGPFLQTEEQLPSIEDYGTDIARTLFEGDVAEGLARLEQVAADPHHPLAAGELRAQAEVLMGLGELLSFSWLVEMAQITLQALDRHPQQAQTILSLALADFRRAQQAVLSGQGTVGIHTSETLQQWAQSDALPQGAEPFESQYLPEDIFGLPENCHLIDSDIFPESEDILEEFSARESIREQDPSSDQIEASPPEPFSLFTSIKSVESVFEEFSDQATIENPSPLTSQDPKPAAHQRRFKSDPYAGLSIRLDLARLEKINNQLGELTILQNKLFLTNQQLQTALQSLSAHFLGFLSLDKQLRSHMNALLFRSTQAHSIYSYRRQFTPETHTKNQTTGFDALELDRYDQTYTLLQTAVEQIAQMEEVISDIHLFVNQSDHDLDQQRRIQNDLRHQLIRSRMLPLGDILERLPRLLRDLSHQYQKPADLKLSGTTVLLDKAILDKLYTPLVHLTRNAFDHGIEDPETRRNLQKPAVGQISIQAHYRGNRTLIEIRDDGGGIDLQKIKQKALKKGLLTPDQLAQMGSQQLIQLIFEPDFSTATTVTELSGRGMGLDIVRSQIASLQGSISVSSELGVGTTFSISLPMTLRLAKLLVLWTGRSLLAISSDTLEQVLVPQPQQVFEADQQRFLRSREGAIPILDLQALLPYHVPPPPSGSFDSLGAVVTPKHWLPPLLLMRQGQRDVAVQVRQLLTEQELVIKPLSPALPYPAYLYGCTILADGTLIPVIDISVLLAQPQIDRTAIDQTVGSDLFATASATPLQPLVQIVDDSTGIRQALKATLEKAGYQVLLAGQGQEALAQLQQQPGISLVICDLEMPIMNGFEFLIQKGQDPTLRPIPVVMLTSRSGDKHKKLALQLGATDYFTKPYLESQFLAALNRILNPFEVKPGADPQD